ncbi:hypothetical protein AVEN_96467-1 [Araneus ventricosus]|uniref:Uncharacterized protein n=1 Tax=Araneus ventricosus TaxID=182803 RepID=A0A4Y2CTS9_ARAVE|nr:hypothetical protein AVEN_96467-1 [Araneus ventricosus]
MCFMLMAFFAQNPTPSTETLRSVKLKWCAADCEIRRVIRFLTARIMESAGIHLQICADNAMSDSKVRKWRGLFKEDMENIHAKSRSDQPSVITDDLVQTIDTQIHANRKLTISKLL